MQHKGPSGTTVQTLNTSLVAVALAYNDATNGGRAFPAFNTEVTSDITTTNALTPALSQVGTPASNTDMFFYSQYNMSTTSTSGIDAPSFDMYCIDAGSYVYTSLTQQRKLADEDDIGSGASVGLAKSLISGTEYTASVRHETVGSVELTTSNIILSGFQTNDQPVEGSWIGGTASYLTTWNNTGNWADGVIPTSTTNVTIYDKTNDPIINASASCNSLYIGADATLDINETKDLTVSGDLDNDGTFTVNSSSSGTGSLIVEGTATGDVTVERFLTHDRWHYIAGQSNISGNFDDLTMGLTGGKDKDQFYSWDETLETLGTPGTWVDILNGNGSGTLMGSEGFVACKGYAINYITTDKTLSLSGTPYTVDKSISLTKTTNSSNLGCNLVGNPFTSTLAVNFNADNTNNFLTQNTAVLDADYVAVYLWNETAEWAWPSNADYLTINNITSGATYIQPGQAFMVVAKTHLASLSFPAAIRKHGTGSFYKNTENDEISRFELGVVNPEGQTNSVLIAFSPEMTNGLDPSYDAGKMSGNPELSLYTKLIEDNGQNFAIQALPPLDGITSVKLGLRAELSGTYKFEPVNIENFDESVSIKLEDKQTGSMVNLTDVPEYTFTIATAGTFEDRFVLHFKGAVGIEEYLPETENIRFYVYENKLFIIDKELKKGTIQIFNLLGQPVMEKQYSTEISKINLDLTKGYYFVRIITEKTNISGKIYIH